MKQVLRSLCVLFAITVLAIPARSQNIGDVIGNVPKENIEGYMLPFANSMGMGLNTGLYNSAKTHGILGFDLTLNILGMSIPTEDQTFTWKNVEFDLPIVGKGSITADDKNAPTVFGSKTILLTYRDSTGAPIDQLELRGTGVAWAPLITPQLSVGFPYIGDITLRYFPEVKLRENVGSVGLMGFGLKHSVDQYIPFCPVHLAVQGFWQKINASYGSVVNNDPDINQGSFNAEGKIETWNLNAIVSKQLVLITFYGAIGIENSEMTVKYTYSPPPLTIDGPPQIQIPVPAVRVKVPFETDNLVRYTGGITLNIVPLFLTAEVSKAEYTALRAGLGFSIR